MTLEVRLRPEAELDLAEAAFWYEGQQKGLGRQFLSEALALFSNSPYELADACFSTRLR